MSAIAGIVRFKEGGVTHFDFETASARMMEPELLEAKCWTEGGAGFVCRQSLVTQEDTMEKQPWIGGGGNLVFIYDGRLDNREEIASLLGLSLKGEPIPDGLLFLRALERWGEDALPKFIGDFALALWDRQKRRLLLARDQLGRRPLYYQRGQGFVAFATGYRPLLALPGVRKSIDELGIADFLILNVTHPENTFYEDVRRVPPATVMLFDGGEPRSERYWSPEPKREIRMSSDEEYAEAMRERLDQAVSCRLRAKDPIATVMSGGLDSSAVATTAARLLFPKRLFTFCSVPPDGVDLPPPPTGWYNDERPYVKEIAGLHPNMDLHLASSVEPHWIETDPTPFFDAGGMPSRNVTHIGWLMPGIDSARAAGSRVMLTGVGGNPVWSWDGMRGLVDLLRQGRWLSLVRELYMIERRRPREMGWKAVLFSHVLAPLEPQGLSRLRSRLKKGERELWSGFSAINPDFAGEIGLYERSIEAGHTMRLNGKASGLGSRLAMLAKMEHGADLFTPMRAIGGIEPRSPLLDPRLIDFCLSIPQELFMKNGVPRHLTRLALSDRLPDSVLKKDGLGMQNPEIMRRQGALRRGLEDEIAELGKIPLAARCLDLPRLERIVRDWPSGKEVELALPRALNVGRFIRWAENGL